MNDQDKFGGVPYRIDHTLARGTIVIIDKDKPTIHVIADSQETLRTAVHLANQESGSKKLVPSKVVESNKTRSCNRHSDCGAADDAAKVKGFFAAAHCHADDCEDCFGC